MPDRHAHAVLARRAELRRHRDRNSGGHRTELRSALALSRLSASADTTAALAELTAAVATHLDRADRAARSAFPDRLGAALDVIARELHAGWAAGLRPALRRIATERSLPIDDCWPRLPPPIRLRDSVPPPTPVGRFRPLLAGAAQGAALWRLLILPLAALPLLGLPVPTPALLPLASGAALVLVAVTAQAGAARAERARLRRYSDGVIAAAGRELAADLARRLLELERSASVALDAAVLRRRAEIDAELVMLKGLVPVDEP